MPNFYAVAKGKQPGIYNTWEDCKKNVDGFPYAKYRKFTNRSEAVEFINQYSAVEVTPVAVEPEQQVSALAQRVDALGQWHSECTNVIGASVTALKDSIRIIEDVHKDSEGEALWALEVASSLRQITQLELLCGRAMVDLGGNISRLKDTLLSLQPCSNSAPVNKPRATLLNATVPDVFFIRQLGSDAGKRRPETVNTGIPAKVARVDGDTFAKDTEGYVQVFTDGSCEKNGQRGSKAGLGVWFGINHPLNLSEPVSGGRSTNNIGEIQAVTRAIEVAKQAGVSKMCINSDSKFVIDSVTKWMPKWKRTGWTLSSGGPVVNRQDFEALDLARKGIALKWNYVPAHQGVLGNECADQLAKEGALRFTRRRR